MTSVEGITADERRAAVAQARAERLAATGVTWEQRMAHQAAERASRVPAPVYVDPHAGHHRHYCASTEECVDCGGVIIGAWSVVLPDPDTPEGAEQLRRLAELTCSVCGERGVRSADR